MYRVLRASILYYENHMRGCKGRYDIIKPLILLVDSSKFKEAKEKATSEYLNLCGIILRMKELYLTGEDKYHHFGMLLNELQVLGFDVENMLQAESINENALKEQVDLILQFLAFRYPFDDYDNRIGVHDKKINEFIFYQP